MRARCAAVWAVLILVICCGGGGLSLEEYASRGAELSTTVISRIVALDAGLGEQELTPAAIKDYWDERVAARADFLEGIQELDPPEGLHELHETALDLFSRLVDAEQALAARVTDSGILAEPAEWWSTPEGEAARAVDQEAIAICRAAQARFDSTKERDALADVPWVPSEMKETVRVAFGCPD